MRTQYLLELVLVAGLLACSSDKATTAPEPPAPPPPGPSRVLLRQVDIPVLPSPYYHFDYDAAGRVSVASFASGFTVYSVTYQGDRIKEMANDAVGNRDKLEYFYDSDGRVETVEYVNPSGAVFAIVNLYYNGAQLTKLERQRTLGSELVVEKTMSFSYYADGNVEQITDHRPAIDGRQPESTTIDRFENYDDKVNVDGFGLIHNDFFDHLVLLPGVVLQKGNPGREIFSGDTDNFFVTYTYTYDDAGRPLTKSGTAVFTSGTNVGQSFPVLSRFSYY